MELKNEKNRKIIDSLSPHSNKVTIDKKASSKLFILARVPIIVITNDKASYFKNAGFEIKELNRYIILEDQLLIGINTRKGSDKATVAKVVESLNLNTHEKHRIIGKPVPINNTGFMWFWVVPEKQVNHYQKMNSVYFNPKGWGFAFK